MSVVLGEDRRGAGGCADVGSADVGPGLSFADLLRQLRTEARLTQEELAEQAGLSPRSVSDLERGINRTARKDSALMLAGALKLTGPVQEAFVAAARGRAEPARVLAVRSEVAPESSAAAATRTLPRDIGGFTGREGELTGLEKSLAKVTGGGLVAIYAIDGMAGIGKTTFAVHAAHRLAGRFPDGQFFLPLHAHTAGQSPVDPADALTSLLMTAGIAAQHIPPGLEARAAKWRDHAAGKKILLLLDDVAGHEQVRPLLPGSADSLVLVTSRRRLTALEDAIVISIDTLSPDEAWALLTRLAGRADLELDESAGREITRLCGYLPLAIGMLARRLRHHPARTTAELAAELAAARDRLAVMRAEDLSVAAAFDLSYQDLTADQQRLFRRLGLAPGPDIDAYAAAALDDASLEDARRQLDELYDHHLLAEPAPGRYLLHDLLREYARALAAAGRRYQTRSCRTAHQLLRSRCRRRVPAHRDLDHSRRTAPADRSARERAAADHVTGSSRLAGRRAPQLACGGQLRGSRGDAAALDRDRRRDGRLPARPRPLAASDGPVPDGAARGAGGWGPPRRGRHA